MLEVKPLITLTATDFRWSYTKGTGAGGQKRNKTSSAVHCHHDASGAHGYSEDSRSQHENRRTAFERCVAGEKFKGWLRVEGMKRSGQMAQIDAEVKRQLNFIKVEVQQEGRWVEVSKHDELRTNNE